MIDLEDTSPETEVQAQTSLKDDEELSITKKKKYKHTGIAFISGSIQIKLNSEIVKMDIIDTVDAMSKPTRRFFVFLKNCRDIETNLCNVDLTKVSQPVLSRAYIELRKLNAITRIRKGLYMINPSLIMVFAKEQKRALDLWKTLTKEIESDNE